MYGKKTHKSVMVAAHSVINLVRELYPALLRKGDRGKFHNIKSVPKDYGELNVSTGVEGIHLLEAYERGDIYINSDDEICWKADDGKDSDTEDMHDGTDDEDEWEYVNDDDDEIVIEDDDDDDGEEDYDNDDEEEEEIEEDDEEELEEDDEEDEEEDDDEEDDDDDNVKGNDDDLVQSSFNKDRKRIDMTRVLSAEDFALLEKLKLAAAERAKDPKYRNKISIKDETEDVDTIADDDDTKPDPSSNLPFNVEPTSLTPGMKVNKLTKIERISHVLKGRKESKWEHEGHAGGLTNKEKERKKNYVMVRKGKKSVANKIRKSNSDVRWDKMHKKEIWGRDKRKRRRT